MGISGRKHRFLRMSVATGLMLTICAVGATPHMELHAIDIASAATTAHADSIRLPLYSGTGKERYATIVYGPSTSQYVKSGSARFVVQADVDKVTSWYLTAMPLHGYRLQSSTPNGGRDALGPLLEFVSKRNSGLDVTIDFRSLVRHPRDLVIEYTVSDITTPPRSPDSLISSDVKKVEIQYQPASTSGATPVIQRTFSDPSVVSTLVHAVNALPVDIRDALYDTSMYQGGATLRFVDSAGHVQVVKVEMGVNRVVVGSTAPLFDVQNHVWQLVSADMGFAPYPPRNS
ncbi:MAG: hypothetical protein K6T83_17435 [Alicyclobacillus sp.]|nr:hypothetical protein [Alicyclobacillus sp.]